MKRRGTALVTGGAGFLGSHLVDYLLRRGLKVVVVDNLVTGARRNLPAKHSSLRVVERDVSDAPAGEYDFIYHLASPASPTAYSRFAVDTLLTNALGTRRVLDIAEDCAAKVLLASTSEIYGDPLVHPQKETYWGNVNPLGPRSQYDEGKRFAEALTLAYVNERGVRATIVRIFNSYGPRMRIDDGRLPSTFIAAALRNAPITVEGHGGQTRSLCFVLDTVAGLVAAMRYGRAGEAYNIGRADEVSVLEFARRVKTLAGSSSPIKFVPSRREDIRRRRPDTRKATAELHWRPLTTLRRGLTATIDWYRSELAPPPSGN